MSDPTDQPDPASPKAPRHPFTYRASAKAEESSSLPPRDPAEETRRNDVMLVIAALLMGLMFAWTTIADSRTLVHIKTGQYLATHGVLPPETDVFSATAGDVAWINVAWLSDLLFAGLYAVGGMKALTILQVVVAMATLLLVLASHRRGVSAWWAALVLVIAGVAAMPDFHALPALFTLLGVALVLRLLQRYRDDIDNAALWWLIPLFLVWGNLDPRMFLGLAVLVLYGLGELIGAALGRSGFEDSPRRWRYWLTVGGCFLASLCNPFTWHAPFHAISLYGRIDPAFRQFYQQFDHNGAVVAPWQSLTHMGAFEQPLALWLDTALLASLLMGLVALVAILLNFRRSGDGGRRGDPGEIALWAGFVALGVVAGREWPVAALVFAVLAIRNAENWYRRTFRQTSSGRRGELLFSRGGRSLTVLAFLALAVLWLTGRVIPEDGRRPGWGLDAALDNEIASLSRLLEDSFNKKVFNFHAGQGDQLIWLGFHPFIDNRLGLYAGERPDSQSNLISLHSQIRRHLASGEVAPRTGDDDGHRLLAQFGIVQAVPRLTFPRPHYETYFDLIARPYWRLAGLQAAGALFYYVGSPENSVPDVSGKLKEFLASNEVAFRREAFVDVEPIPDVPFVWAQPGGWLSRLTRPDPISNRLARARHCAEHFERMRIGSAQFDPAVTFALAQIGIHDCYHVLAGDPQNARAYRCLGVLFQMLYVHEQRLTAAPMRRRLFQAIGVYGQSLRLEPRNPATHESLVALYLAFDRFDLAAQARQRYERFSGKELFADVEPAREKRLSELWNQVRDNIDTVTQETEAQLGNGQPRLNVATFAWQSGCTLLALEILAGEPDLAEKNAAAALLKAKCLLEAAQPRDAYEILSQLQQAALGIGLGGWREPLALASLALPDFQQAAELYRGKAEQLRIGQMIKAMQAIPLAGRIRGFPSSQTFRIRRAMIVATQNIADQRLNAALCALDAGRIPQAEQEFASLLEDYPNTAFTPLVRYYLQQIRGVRVVVDFGQPESSGRFTAIRSHLNDRFVRQQLEAAGPVTAPRPAP